MRFKMGAAEEETGEDGEVLEGWNHVGIKGVEGGRVGRRYRRGAPAERTGSDRAAGAREGRAKPKREAERVARKLDEWAREGERGVASDGVSWGMVRSKGLMKRVLWVRSVGKGSRVRD